MINRDKEKLLEYLEKANERFSIIIHTYCLMSKHFHLLVEAPQPNLSVVMQWINVSYATYFNRKRGRHRHLIQGRFSVMSCKDLGLYIGGVSGALITNMYNRIKEEAAKKRQLKRRIKRVRKRIFNI